MLCLGIDPDMHDLAIASWDDLGPVTGHVVSVPRAKTGDEALLAMMHELSKPWPAFSRVTKDMGTMPDWCAVEGQDLRRGPGAKHARPEDIVKLGNVAGMAVMRVAMGYLRSCGVYWPRPSEWKGGVPKAVMQARLYTELGWGYDIRGKGPSSYAVPTAPMPIVHCAFDVKSAQWKHLGDALLLARWCWEQASGRAWVAPKKVG